jgi:hypothetical protein
MNETVSPATKILPYCGGFRGQLRDIIQPDGENIVLAGIGEEWVELPRTLAPHLWQLVGQRVVVARIGEEYRVGGCA